MKKVSPEQLMEEMITIKNQIAGLEMLMESKKKKMATFFEASGESKIQGDQATVYVKKTVNVDYDMHEIVRKVDKKLYSGFIKKVYEIHDWPSMARMLKSHGVTPQMVRPYLTIRKSLDQNALSAMYDRGKISLKDLEGCYTATVKKSVVLKMNNTDSQIPITVENKGKQRNGKEK